MRAMFTHTPSYAPRVFGDSDFLKRDMPSNGYKAKLPIVPEGDGLETPQWQLEDLLHLYKRPDASANWSEMGCYKTSSALWLSQAKTLNVKNPSVLVITTRSGKGTYFENIPKILKGWNTFNITTREIRMLIEGKEIKLPGLKFLPKNIEVPNICVTHYHVFSRCNRGRFEENADGSPKLTADNKMIPLKWVQGDYILDREWDLVILDEAHRIKEKDNRWTVNIKKVKAKYRHVMTGTGFINRPDEIWSLLNFLDRKTWSGYNRFKEYFCEIDDWDGFAKVVGIKPERKEEFRQLVRMVGVRRTLDEVMPHIRQPIPQRHEIELNATQRKMYNDIKRDLFLLDQAGEIISSPNVLSLLNRLRQITVATPRLVETKYDPKLDRRVQHVVLEEPSSKLDTLMEIIEGLQWTEEHKEPIVVFSCFKDPLELFKARLDKHNAACVEMGMPEIFYMRYIHMEQKDSDAIRYQKWHEDFPSGKFRIFMSTLQLGGESINLSSARHVCFLDRSWSPKDNSQGIGRIRRPGQEGQPVVINIEALNTTDQRVERTNLTKQGWFNEIFGDEKP